MLYGDSALEDSVIPFPITDRKRFAKLVIAGSGVGFAIGIAVLTLGGKMMPNDAPTYLAAGERLNAGHLLYALSPGDRVLRIIPPFWSVPLVSPPLTAVLWRPLALFGEPVLYPWWALTIASLLSFVALIYRTQGLSGPIAIWLISVPLGVEAAQGNINTFLELGTLGVWYFWVRDRPGLAGLLAAVMAVAKLTPAALCVWLLAVSGRRSVTGLAVGLVGAGLVSVLGAGIRAHVDYLGVIQSSGPSPFSLGAIADAVGFPSNVSSIMSFVVATLGLIGVLLLHDRPAAAYRVAIITMVFGSPALYPNTFVFLGALLAPSIWRTTTAIGSPRIENTSRSRRPRVPAESS